MTKAKQPEPKLPVQRGSSAKAQKNGSRRASNGINDDASPSFSTLPTVAAAEAAAKSAQLKSTAKGKKANAVAVEPQESPKARPASAGVKQSKSSSANGKQARPASASANSKAGNKTSNTPETDQPLDPNDQTLQQKYKKMAEEDEDAARGIYKVFIQTRRCENICYGLGLTLENIRKMKRKYDENDMYNTGEITQAEFFYMINEESRPLTKGIFQFADMPSDQKLISFDQYLLCVVQFASLTKPELFQYVFDLYDDDKSGTLDEREFMRLSAELQSKQFHFPKNVETAMRMLQSKEAVRTGSDDGLVDLGQFMTFSRYFPVAFYPIVNMQKNVRAATMGESFWAKVVGRKMKVQELVSYMRRNHGAVPELTSSERFWSIFSNETFAIRKRAGELYGMELAHRRELGWDPGDA